MILDVSLLPKKLNELNYFKKIDGGVEIYSYAENLKDRNEVIVIKIDGFEIDNDFCVKSKALDMVRVLNPADITITDKSFIIKSKKGKFTSKLINETFYNLFLNEEEATTIEANIDTLNKASMYVSKNDKKPALTGVRLDANSNVYATDSFKAYLYQNGEFSDDGITIPVNFIKTIKDLTNDNNIKIIYNKNIAMIENNNIRIYTRLLDSAYPKMVGIFARGNNAEVVEIDKEEIVDRLGIASNVGLDDDKKIVVALSRNQIEVLGNNNFVSEIKFENGNAYTLKLQLELLDLGFRTLEKDFNFSVIYEPAGKTGTMAFLKNEKEIVLLLGIR